MSVTRTRYFLENREWLCERMTYDEVELADEMVAYDLIHALLSEIRRLEQMVMDTRGEVNALSTQGDVYDFIPENVSDGTFYDHPAIKRYIELFEDEATIPWES